MDHVTGARYKECPWHIHLYKLDKLRILPILDRNEGYMDCIVKCAIRISLYPDSLKI
jgi:hypothetical protein